MSNPIAIEASRNGKRKAVEKLYGYLTLHEPTETSDSALADRFRIPKQDIRNLRADLVEIGSMQVARQGLGKRGIVSVWTLTVPLEVTKARLEAKWRKDDEHTAEIMRKPNAAKGRHNGSTLAARPPREPGEGWTNGAEMKLNLGNATPAHPVVPDVLVASAGPDAKPAIAERIGPARYDEPRALIEAARQYHHVNAELDKKVKELEQLGMQVDRAALAKAIKAPHDHRLLVVSQILPYIENLERTVTRLSDQVADLRTKASSATDLEITNRHLSDNNKRLVSENHALREQLNARPAVQRAPTNGAATAEVHPAPKAPAPTPVG